jgi:hypothetical protein
MVKTPTKAIEHRGITIRERKSATGGVSYRVECPMDWFGKRTFKQFKTKAKCKGFIDNKVNERNQFGELASALTASERTDALNALKVIKGSGATLKECAQFFIAHNRPPAGNITIKELVELYIEKRKKGLGTRRARTLSRRSMEDIINRLNAFSNAYDTKQAKEITSGQIEEWLHREEWSLQTRLNYYRVLHTFFQFAIESGYRTDNPMKKVPKPSPETPEPGILSVVEFERLLNESLDYELVIGNPAVRRLIRDNLLHQIENVIQTSKKEGMVLFDNCLFERYSKCEITYDTAISHARDPEGFERRLQAQDSTNG